MTKDGIANYEQLNITNQNNNKCLVAGIPLLLARNNTELIESESDFIIVSDFEVTGKKPIILPHDKFSETWVYTTKDVKWKPDEYEGRIPEKNEKPLEESTLPITEDPYPWLSIGNFLADNIIELPYEIDSDKFVTGNGKNGNKYLLPLTETFFKYYHVDSVQRMLQIDELGQGTVSVKLNIKTKRGDLKFEKNYKPGDKVKLELHLAVLPFVKVTNNYPIKYNIGVIDADLFNNQTNNIRVDCIQKGVAVRSSTPVIRAPGDQKTIKSFYVSTEGYFDSIQITYNNRVQGFVIPKMTEYRPSSESCSFSIDFGTTNTHIEYKKGSDSEVPFSNPLANPFFCSLLDRKSNFKREYEVNEERFENELLPFTIGDKNSEIHFPLRTAMVESDVNFDMPVEIFKHLNNYLLYEIRSLDDYLTLNTTLKWEALDDPHNRIRLNAFIENLVWYIFFKSLTLNINIYTVNVVWFYPVSMGDFQKGLMREAWENSFLKIFGKKFPLNNIKSIPESIGPYIYYFKIRGISGLSVSIDIGGGSTDISLFDQDETKIISSVRFAGDAIFGDGYGKNPNTNGFVNLAFDQVRTYIDKNKIGSKTLENIVRNRRASNDFSSYLFSLSQKSNGAFDYPSIIRNDSNVKLVILLFHSALAFYIGKLLKNEGYENPKKVLFSGSASKTVLLLDATTSLSKISQLYKYFFQQIIGEPSTLELQCNLSIIPKEITCKGGLLSGDMNIEGYKQGQVQ